jgi:hypothetical protein
MGGLGFIHDELPNGEAKKRGVNEAIKNKKMVTIDQEIAALESMYNQTTKDVTQDMNALRKRVNCHKEPESVGILESQIAREREYVQN